MICEMGLELHCVRSGVRNCVDECVRASQASIMSLSDFANNEASFALEHPAFAPQCWPRFAPFFHELEGP
jgi:hypothetical protein